jgi:hypothetical protein
MAATFVTFTSQIPSEVPPPPSLASRIANFINDSFVADAPLTTNAGAAVSVPTDVVDTATSASTVQHRSKRTCTRQPSNDQLAMKLKKPMLSLRLETCLSLPKVKKWRR